jgi:transcriptional regulator with XRE-family HTH domain
MDGKPSITDRLNAAFDRSGLSQAELARMVGLTRGSINSWLRGRSINIRPEHLFAVADALRVEARWLATGAGPMERQLINGDIRTLLDSYATLRTDEREAVRLLVNQIAEGRSEYRS